MAWLTGWSNCKKFTAPANLIDADLPYFPAPVYLRSTDTVIGSTQDLCTGGTPVTSGSYSTYVASNAFDDSATTQWQCSALYTGTSGIGYIGYQFASPKAIQKINITVGAGGTGGIVTSMKLQCSDTGSFWTDLDTLSIPAAAGTYTLTGNSARVSALYWRLKANSNPPSSRWEVDEIEMLDTVYVLANFDFSKAKADGSDIRFTDKNLNPLKFERVHHYDDHMRISTSTIGTDQLNYTKSGMIVPANTTVVEAKARVESSGTSYSQTLTVRNGTKMFAIALKADRVICNALGATQTDYMMDTTNADHIYTLKLNTTSAELLVDNVSVFTTAYSNLYSIATNQIDFGDGSTAANYGGSVLWKYVKYNLDYVGTPTAFVEWKPTMGLPSANGWTATGTASLATIYTASGRYNVLIPAVTDATDTEFYMWYGNPAAYNDSIEAWQDKTGKQLTYNGNVKLVPNIAKFGKAAYFDGTGDYLQLNNSTDFQFGTNDFTIEWWEYQNSIATNQAIFNQWSGTNDYGMMLGYDGTQMFSSSGTSSWDVVNAFRYGDKITGRLVHRALVRRSGTLYGYQDGKFYASVAMAGVPYFNISQPVYFGAYRNNAAFSYLNGYIDEFRISNTARYTSDFIPSQSPYTVDANTKLLLHFDDFDAMRIATSTTGADQCYFSRTISFAGNKTGVVEFEAKVESSGTGVTQQQFQYADGSKYFTVNLFTDKATIRSSATALDTIPITLNDTVHKFRLVVTGGTDVKLYIDEVLKSTIAYSALTATASNSCLFGDADTAANVGGNTLWRYVKWNTDYIGNPTGFSEWNPTKGLPSANGWTANGTSTLAALTFKDETGKAVYTYGDVKPIKTAYADGARGAYFDGTGDYFSFAGQSDFALGNGDFCIEVIHYASALGYKQVLFDTRPLTTNGVYVTLYIATDNKIYLSVNNVDVIVGTAITLGTLNKIKLSKVSGFTKLLLNDVQIGSTYTDNNTYLNGANRPVIGVSAYDLSGGINGNLLGMRVTKGRGRAGASVPDKFDIDGSDVVFCTNFDTIYDCCYAMVQHMGDSLVDATGNGNNGTATGTTVVDTTLGKQRDFSGSNQYISFQSVVTPIGAKTIMLLNKHHDISTHLYEYMNADASGNAGDYGFVFITDGAVAIRNAAASPVSLGATPANTLNQDMVNAFSWDGTTAANKARLFRDGTIINSGTATGTEANTPSRNLTLGRRGVDTQYMMDGLMGAVRVSSIGRSDAWIKAESLALKDSLLSVVEYTASPGNSFFGMNF